MRFFITLCAGIACAVTLASCSSPTQSINFQAPSGWSGTPSFFGFQAWTSPDKKQVLLLARLPVSANMNTAMQQSNFQSMQTTAQKRIKICGNQPAVEITGRGENRGNQTEQEMEMIFTSYSNATYLSIYSRDVGEPVNAQAEAALTELCQHS